MNGVKIFPAQVPIEAAQKLIGWIIRRDYRNECDAFLENSKRELFSRNGTKLIMIRSSMRLPSNFCAALNGTL